MKYNYIISAVICGLTLLSTVTEAADRKLRKHRDRASEVAVKLTEHGKKLEAKYSEMLNTLKAEIERELPTIGHAKKTAFLAALKAEKKAFKQAVAKAKELRICRGKEAKLKEAQAKLKEAPNRVVDAQARLQRALAMPEGSEEKAKTVKWFQVKLEKRQADLKKFADQAKKAEAALEKARQKEPELVKKSEDANKAYEQAKTNTRKAVDALGLDSLSPTDELNAKIAKCVILTEATPRCLAEFAQQGPAKEILLGQLFSNTKLMIQMLVADGALWGKYGEAMELYTTIQKASEKAREGIFQRLALAVSLEHAVPLLQRNAKARTDAPKYVDPVKRYLSYEKNYLEGELDPVFKDLTVWELRMVVNGKDPDDVFAWGRKMLSNFRPSTITRDYSDGRYVQVVDNEIFYGSDHVADDRPELEFFQNVLANGGICGRRAFFGRFILRAYGIPTAPRREPGHATLVHWTPNGWETKLGGQWSGRASMNRYGNDMDFLANTQARKDSAGFTIVKRLQWIGDIMGETPVYGHYAKADPDLWYGLSLVVQRRIIDQLKAAGKISEPAGESKANSSIKTVQIPETERKITVDNNGVITIPAAACSNPTNNTDIITFVESNLGGMQLHYSRQGGSDIFEYTFDAPKSGKYQLTARVVTPAWKQHLFVSVNGAENPVDMELPYTVGMWGTTEPVVIDLVKGKNILTFSRAHYFHKGVTIKNFKLTPID